MAIVKVRTKDGSEKVDLLEEKDRNYESEFNFMELVTLEKSADMDLKQIIFKIKEDKEYVFDFIKHPTIEEMTKGVGGLYKFNKDEVTDMVAFVITEYFYKNDIDLNNFDEEEWLDELKKYVRTNIQKQIRHGYSGHEYPSSGWNKYENEIMDDFNEDIIISSIDISQMDFLNSDEKEILELYYIDKCSQQKIAEIMNLNQMKVSRTLTSLKNYFLLNKTCV